MFVDKKVGKPHKEADALNVLGGRVPLNINDGTVE